MYLQKQSPRSVLLKKCSQKLREIRGNSLKDNLTKLNLGRSSSVRRIFKSLVVKTLLCSGCFTASMSAHFTLVKLGYTDRMTDCGMGWPIRSNSELLLMNKAQKKIQRTWNSILNNDGTLIYNSTNCSFSLQIIQLNNIAQ